MSRPLLGAHVSAAGGLSKAIVRAEALSAEAIQIFGASPRQWKATLPSEEEVTKYKEAIAESRVKAVYLHASYLVNLATDNKELRKKSIDNLAKHFEIANSIDADGLIFHLGSGSIAAVAQGIDEVAAMVPGKKTKLVMENSSSGGNKVGATTEDLKYLFEKVESKRIALCIDTAHIFAAGVLQYEPTSIRKFFDEWERDIGMESLVALHVNDSKAAFASYVDRHENLGEGQIGITGLRNLAKEKRVSNTAWILEVPGFDGKGPDKKNLDIMKGFFSG